jgi:hypothetical protein
VGLTGGTVKQRWSREAERTTRPPEKKTVTPAQKAHALKVIDAGEHREGVAAFLIVDRSTLYRALPVTAQRTGVYFGCVLALVAVPFGCSGDAGGKIDFGCFSVGLRP